MKPWTPLLAILIIGGILCAYAVLLSHYGMGANL